DVAVAADHRPVADHLVHGFGQRPGGRQILQDVDALARAYAFENTGLDLGEVEHGFPGRVLQPDDVEPLDIPAGDILGEGQRRHAVRLELELQSLRGRIGLKGHDAGPAALGGGQLPLPDHALFQRCRILRSRRRSHNRQRGHRRNRKTKAKFHEPDPYALAFTGVSATGVSGGFPANQAFRLSTTSWSMALRVTTDAEPICGSSTTLSMDFNSSGTCGSRSNTSSPA